MLKSQHNQNQFINYKNELNKLITCTQNLIYLYIRKKHITKLKNRKEILKTN